MHDLLGFAVAGLGAGGVIASLALGLILTYRSSGTVNFAHVALGTYLAFAFFEFRETGDLVLPVIGFSGRFHLLPRPTLASAIIVIALLGAVLGALLYLLIFRPLRESSPLAQLIASLGLLLYLQDATRQRFPTAGAAVTIRRPVLPTDPLRIGTVAVTENRLWLAGGACVVTALLSALYRYSRFGLATRAAASNERAALLLGLSPDRIATINWSIGAILAGIAVVLIEPISGLDATTTPLLVVPALAAAMLGGLKSFSLTTLCAFGLSSVQSVILGILVRPETTWLPKWLPAIGVAQSVPVLAILITLMWRSDALPTRSSIAEPLLPPSPSPRHILRWALAGWLLVAVSLLFSQAWWREALIVSMIFALLALSIVVCTGYVGQISLAQLAFAGIGGFSAIHLARAGVPFPVVLVAVGGLTSGLGILIGYPAIRIRGMGLAIATLASAVAIEQLILASPSFSGGLGGASAPRPSIAGIDLGVSAKGSENYRPAFVLTVLTVLTGACVAVSLVRRSRIGLRWLAVRSNERGAAASGIDVGRTKLEAFSVAAGLAGVAGALMAFHVTTLSPNSFMAIGALVAVAFTYLAGITSVSGALLAGVLTQAGIAATLGSKLSGTKEPTSVAALAGLLLILTAILAPAGITGAARTLVSRVRPTRTSKEPTEAGTDLPAEVEPSTVSATEVGT